MPYGAAGQVFGIIGGMAGRGEYEGLIRVAGNGNMGTCSYKHLTLPKTYPV